MKIKEITEEKGKPSQGWDAYCKNTPRDKMSASWRSSCVARGKINRDTNKTQKVGNKRRKIKGKAASTKHGGWVHPTKAG